MGGFGQIPRDENPNVQGLPKVDLIGALCNPTAKDALSQLVALKRKLLKDAPAVVPPSARPLARAGELLQSAVAVLSDSDRPLRVAEVRQEIECRLGRPVNPGSVKACLSEWTIGPSPRFERVERGVYRLARP